MVCLNDSETYAVSPRDDWRSTEQRATQNSTFVSTPQVDYQTAGVRVIARVLSSETSLSTAKRSRVGPTGGMRRGTRL